MTPGSSRVGGAGKRDGEEEEASVDCVPKKDAAIGNWGSVYLGPLEDCIGSPQRMRKLG